jgi:hypothetical protein
MNRFICKLGIPLALVLAPCAGAVARADVAAKPVTARVASSDLSREFSVVPAGDPLYAHLSDVRGAGWSTLTAETSAAMTRYEMALETAKALIAVRARQRADENWATTAPKPALQSLRALCAGLQSELTRFDIDSKSAIAELGKWIDSGEKSRTSPVEATINAPLASDAFSVGSNSAGSNSVGSVSMDAMNRFSFASATRPGADGESATLQIPLSQRLRVYGAVASLARSAYDPLQSERSTPNGSLHLGENSRSSFGSAGASLALTNWLQLRGEASRRATASTLSGALGKPFLDSQSSASGNERSLGGGVDLTISPGIVLSGDVAHFKSEGGLLSGLSAFSGTRYAGGLELSGWQNRVALSANLSRLVPEDSLALSMTAAQLNLGVGLTQQISLKLLYQQLFETPQQARGNRVFAGGININF